MSTRILAIETSCDETAIALIKATLSSSKGGEPVPNFEVLAEEVSSQIPIHRHWGGVVPNLAKREHLKNLPIVYKKLLQKCHSSHNCANGDIIKIDLIAVTVGPGLEPALWTGINFVQELGKKLNVPVVGANHLEGHIFSNWLPPVRNPKSKILNPKSSIKFPAIVLLVSGGHTMLILMNSLVKWQVLGETRDDAVGEAFDKVAKMLGLPYPGGPEVEKLSKSFSILSKRSASKDYILFPRPMIHEKNYDFSFSGLKTAVLYYLRDNSAAKKEDICASFQKAAIDVLVYKTMKAVEEYNAKSVLLCGGVASNKALQSALEYRIKNLEFRVNFLVPPLKYNTDNATMIGAAAYINYLQDKSYKLEAQGNLGI